MLNDEEKQLWSALTKLLCQLMGEQNQLRRELSGTQGRSIVPSVADTTARMLLKCEQK